MEAQNITFAVLAIILSSVIFLTWFLQPNWRATALWAASYIFVAFSFLFSGYFSSSGLVDGASVVLFCVNLYLLFCSLGVYSLYEREVRYRPAIFWVALISLFISLSVLGMTAHRSYFLLLVVAYSLALAFQIIMVRRSLTPLRTAVSCFYGTNAIVFAIFLVAGFVSAPLDVPDLLASQFFSIWIAFMMVVGAVGMLALLLETVLQRSLHRANFDSLTDLPNRKYFETETLRALSFAQRERRSVGIVVVELFDLEGLRKHRGYGAGDQAIASVAGAITATLRRSDVVSRIRDNAFAANLQAHNLDDEALAGVCRRLHESVKASSDLGRGAQLARLRLLGKGETASDLSFGIGAVLVSPGEEEDPHVLLDRAMKDAEAAAAKAHRQDSPICLTAVAEGAAAS